MDDVPWGHLLRIWGDIDMFRKLGEHTQNFNLQN
jgi:hypothetical protein